jgi:hypothetical protein
MRASTKREMKRWSALLIIDILLIGGWIVYNGADPSGAIIVPFYLLPTFMINIIATVIMYFIKKKYMYLFFINAFVSPILLLCFWMWNIQIQRHIFMESWTFEIDKMPYDITYHDFGNNESSTYDVAFHRDKYSSIGEDWGTVFRRNDTIFFHSKRDSTMVYYLYKKGLYNFRPYHLNERETSKRITVDKRY